MIRGVFDISNDFNVILNPAAVKICPGLSKLSNEELLYIIYVYDYRDSPLRKKPEHERKQNATRRLFSKEKEGFNPERKKVVKEGIKDYQSLIYDQRLTSIERYEKKITLLENTLDIEESPNAIKSLISSIKAIRDAISELEDEFLADEEMIHLKGNKQLTWLEEKIFNERKKNYNRDRVNA